MTIKLSKNKRFLPMICFLVFFSFSYAKYVIKQSYITTQKVHFSVECFPDIVLLLSKMDLFIKRQYFVLYLQILAKSILGYKIQWDREKTRSFICLKKQLFKGRCKNVCLSTKHKHLTNIHNVRHNSWLNGTNYTHCAYKLYNHSSSGWKLSGIHYIFQAIDLAISLFCNKQTAHIISL